MVSATTDRRQGLVGNTPIKVPVAAATTVSITLSGEQTVDGVAVLASNAAGVPDRVLVKDQTSAVNNGIYDISTGSWTRSKDANGNFDLTKGTLVYVLGGTTNGGAFYSLTTANPITIGSSSLVWALSVAAGSLATQLASFAALLGSYLIGWIQAGTGAVGRTVRDKLRDVVSVKDFGAVGDGVTDDTTAIVAAIAAVTEGGTVFFPASAGHYLFTQLTITKTVWLVGDGWHCAVQANFGDAAYLTSGATGVSGSVLRSTYTGAGSAITSTTTNKGPRFKDCILVGPGSGTSTAITFGSFASYQVLGTWDDFMVANFYRGIVNANVEDWAYGSLRVRGMSTEGIVLQSGGAVVNTTQDCYYNLEIQRCTTGLLVTEASTIGFWGGLFQNCTTAIKLAPSAAGRVGGISFHKTWFENNTNNIALDLTNGGVENIELNGTNHNGSGNFFALTNPANNTVTRLGLNNVTASGYTLNLSPGVSVGPAFVQIYGKGNQFSTVGLSNATPANELLYTNPYNLLSTGIPFVVVSSGTMGNNGAISAITAVAAIYPKAYVYLPANAIVAGSAAGWYYAVFASTTTATVYNNTYTSGVPTVPGSPTAFATVGPGAFVQTTATYLPSVQVLLPGNALSTSGNVRFDAQQTNNNSANGKFFGAYSSTSTALGTRLMTFTTTVNLYGQVVVTTISNGSLTAQNSMGIPSAGLTQSSANRTTVNFGSDMYLQFPLFLSNVADTITLEGCAITVSP